MNEWMNEWYCEYINDDAVDICGKLKNSFSTMNWNNCKATTHLHCIDIYIHTWGNIQTMDLMHNIDLFSKSLF